MNDRTMQLARYFLIAGGMGLAGWLGAQITADQAGQIADAIIAATPAVISVGTMIYGVWVKRGTVSVPTATVQQAADSPTVPTIPVVSSVTGEVYLPSSSDKVK